MSIRSKMRIARRAISRKTFYFWGYRRYRFQNRLIPLAHPADTLPRLFVDVSVIAHTDAATGIQRVVRSILYLLHNARHEYLNEIIFLTFSNGRYHEARIVNGKIIEHRAVEPDFRAGDIFFGLDYALDSIWHVRDHLASLRHKGVRFWFLVHDILPLSHPHWFTRPTVERFRNWLCIIGTLAEGFFCVSGDVESKLRATLARSFKIKRPYETRVLPMGWDLKKSQPSTGLPDNFEVLIETLGTERTILMVGTIEPRKGHADVLHAMDVLWAGGKKYNLVLVGAPGWHTEELQNAITTRARSNGRLHWLSGISDEALMRLYAVCTGVVMASHAEGFGLPLVEAIGHGKPVLARGITTFAGHADKGVTFFAENATPAGLAAALEAWMESPSKVLIDPKKLNGWQDAVDFVGSTLLSRLEAKAGGEASTASFRE